MNRHQLATSPAAFGTALRRRLAAIEGRHRSYSVDERGFTLVELAIVLVVMSILFAITVPILDTVLQTSSKVDATYSNVDEQLWLGTVLQRLVRSAVAPAPTTTTTLENAAAFSPGSITPTSMTFFTDAGTGMGPEKVQASCTTHTSATLCAPTATFTVTITRAKTNATPLRNCPTTTGTSTHVCTWTPATLRTVVTIPHVKNGTHGQALFIFAYGPQPLPGKPMTTTTVCGPGRTTTCAAGSTDANTFTSCTAGTSSQPFANCKAGEIRSVTYDLQINTKTTVRYGGAQAEDDTGIFVLSATSMLFNPSVG